MKKIARLAFAFCASVFMPIFSFAMETPSERGDVVEGQQEIADFNLQTLPSTSDGLSLRDLVALAKTRLFDNLFGVHENVVHEVLNGTFVSTDESLARLDAAFKSKETDVKATMDLVAACKEKGIAVSTLSSVQNAKQLFEDERKKMEDAYASETQAASDKIKKRALAVQKSVADTLAAALVELTNLEQDLEKIKLAGDEKMAYITALTEAKATTNYLHPEIPDFIKSVRLNDYDLQHLQEKTETNKVFSELDDEVARIRAAAQKAQISFEEYLRIATEASVDR